MLCILGTAVESLGIQTNIYSVKEVHENMALEKIEGDDEAKPEMLVSNDGLKEPKNNRGKSLTIDTW